jgi:hypothetical protein
MTPPRGRSLMDVMGSIEPETPASEPAVAPATASKATAAAAVVPVNVLVTPADRKRLRQLSLDTDMSLQKLGHEAWNMLLASRGLPPLETVSANVPSGRKRRDP